MSAPGVGGAETGAVGAIRSTVAGTPRVTAGSSVSAAITDTGRHQEISLHAVAGPGDGHEGERGKDERGGEPRQVELELAEIGEGDQHAQERERHHRGNHLAVARERLQLSSSVSSSDGRKRTITLPRIVALWRISLRWRIGLRRRVVLRRSLHSRRPSQIISAAMALAVRKTIPPAPHANADRYTEKSTRNKAHSRR
jgi:hypothetical protein